jgi:predicted Zn-dependent peptidase
LAAAALLWFTAARADVPKPATPELLPAYARTTLPNGLTLLLLEHHELPVVNFVLTLRTGSIADPRGKEGLADVTLEMLRKGTESRTAEQIADELDFLGGRLGISTSYERCSLSADFLAKDVEQGLGLVADILLRPSFPADELDKMLKRNVDGIRELKDNPRVSIANYYDAALFAGHPFGRPIGGTETSLPAIGRDDVQAFYSGNVLPNAAILAVVGDFKADAMRAQVESALGAWERKPFQAVSAPAPKPVKGRKVLLVDKQDATQTYFRIGNVGVPKGNPDEAALDVINTVFGGRFTSWLSTELRIKSGLSYNAHSVFVERRVPGAFYISSFTRTDDTGKAVDLALEVLERLHQQGLSQEELDSARNYIRGQFPPDYETPEDLAGAMAELEFFGLDRDFINGHTQRTDAVTLAETKRVVAKYYPRKDLVTTLVGQAGAGARLLRNRRIPHPHRVLSYRPAPPAFPSLPSPHRRVHTRPIESSPPLPAGSQGGLHEAHALRVAGRLLGPAGRRPGPVPASRPA